MKKIILLSAVFFCCLKLSYGQAGHLDSSFGSNGIVKADLGSKIDYSCFAKQVLVQSDGSNFLLLQLSDQILIIKTHSDGSPDSSYGRNGYSSQVTMYGRHAVFQPDGKIVVVGRVFGGYDDFSDLVLARYNTDGSLDKTFSGDGKRIDYFDYTGSVAIQNDGKIVVAGSSGDFPADFLVARYNTDGSLDATFAGTGVQVTNFGVGDSYAQAVAIQNDGKIVAAGFNRNDFTVTLIRYNKDGSFDSSFSDNGIQETLISDAQEDFAIQSIAIQSDGKITIGGNGDNNTTALLRYNTDGNADTTFGIGGIQLTNFSIASIAIQKDGKLVATGGSNNNFTLSRFNTDGSLDNTFSDDGMQTTSFAENASAYSVAIKNDGQIVVAGASGNNFALARYNVDGSIDNTFDEDGKLTDHVRLGSTFYTGSAIQTNGKLVTTGYTWNGSNYDFVVSRYNTNGSPDSTFSGNGSQITDFGSDDRAYSVAIQTDGKIVAAGSAAGNFALIRYNIDGSLDNTFSSDGKQTTDFSTDKDIARSIAIQSDGKIVAAGGFDLNPGSRYVRNGFAIARYNTDGSLDNTFSNDGTQTLTSLNDARSVAIQADGKIVALGGVSVFEIVRFNTDGSLDNTFGNNGVQTTNYDPYYDPEYNPDAYNRNFGYSVAIQKDGKIVAGGYYEYGDREYYDVLALGRYNQDGSLDNSFSEDGMQTLRFLDNSFITSIALQTNGKIVVAGYIRRDMNNNFAIFRFNNDGNIDTSFGGNGIQVTPVSDANDEIQSIAIAGSKLYSIGHGQYPDNTGVIARFLLDNEDKAPTVTLSILNNIVKYTGFARIKLNAAVSNVSGTITKVQFYNGTTLLHTETEAPYGFLWINVPAGNYTLTAKATDNNGNVITSNSITVSVVQENVPPVVSIVSPVNDTTYTGPATIRLIANAKDPNDKISKVEFYNGSTLLRTEYYYPYTYTWTNVQPGTYTLTAVATDDEGLSATSALVTVTVTTPNLPIVRSRPSSVKQNDLNDALSLRLSPNPASNTLQIFTKGLQLNKPSTISVVSASGIVMKTINANTSKQTVQLDVSSLASGVYTLKVISGGKVMYKQFVKL